MKNKKAQDGMLIVFLVLILVVAGILVGHTYFKYGCIFITVTYDYSILSKYNCSELRDMMLLEISPDDLAEKITTCKSDESKITIDDEFISLREVRRYYKEICMDEKEER